MPRRWMIQHLAHPGTCEDRHGLPPRLFGGRELHMLVGLRHKWIVVGFTADLSRRDLPAPANSGIV
jgi:hypothetical protein